MSERLRRWRAPRWMPLFIRRRFLGVWTEAEVAELRRSARERMSRIDFY